MKFKSGIQKMHTYVRCNLVAIKQTSIWRSETEQVVEGIYAPWNQTLLCPERALHYEV
jgi:hypothetical protein